MSFEMSFDTNEPANKAEIITALNAVIAQVKSGLTCGTITDSNHMGIGEWYLTGNGDCPDDDPSFGFDPVWDCGDN